ncbi:MAG: glycosyltransferase family 2 protein [Burkholderiales bacterium]
MGTYNGARYVEEQIRSIQAQTYPHWTLWIRDDGSRDGTPALLRTLAAADTRLRIVEDTLGNLGFNNNFHHLLSQSTAGYTLFADQDDVWHTQKIEKTLNAMLAQEREHPGAPVLVHCDAIVADSDLRPIQPFFVARRAVHRGLATALFANPTQGATMMVNGPLRELIARARPTVHYDYQAALIAEATGYRCFLKESLLHYRQHAANALGALSRKTADDAAATPSVGMVSDTFQLGLTYEPQLKATLESVRDCWHPGVDALLARHARYVYHSPSLFNLLWALKTRYTFFRRRDHLDALLFAVGLLRGRPTVPH